ncbi:MAG: AAA family ATPase [Planctomycetales bacterium]|nr:AAA family ATPase [Planctomycetales bacterium]
MSDQADELRQLVLRNAALRRMPDAPAPPVVTVAGGKRSVGATTVALNLAVSFARSGQRVVLVDADPFAPGATRLCGVADGENLSDVVSGRRTVHEVLQRGPAGIQLLPGSATALDHDPLAQQRILTEISRLGLHADVVLLDIGARAGDIATRFWQVAHQVLVVTTCDAESIMETYAAIKIVAAHGPCGAIRPVVNQAPSDSAAESVEQRIAQACSKFLELETLETPWIPRDAGIPVAQRKGQLLAPPATPAGEASAAQAFDNLADIVAHGWQPRARKRQVA